MHAPTTVKRLRGQDPEGNERVGEVRLALLEPFGACFLVGLDGRLRFDLGSQAAKLAQHNEPTMDAVAGPTILALLGPIAISAQGGAAPSGCRVTPPTASSS